MALSLPRWAVGTALACLGLAAILLPPAGTGEELRYLPWAWLNGYALWHERGADPLLARHNRLSTALRNTSLEWYVLTWRDSIVAERRLIEDARGKEPVLLVRSAVPPARLAGLREGLARAWKALPRRDSLAWTIVTIVPDSVPGPTGNWLRRIEPSDRYVLSEPLLGPHGCALLVSAAAVARGHATGAIRNALTPCAWRAAFGPPAPSLNQWLRRTDWGAADNAGWWFEADAPVTVSYWELQQQHPFVLTGSRETQAHRLAEAAARRGWLDAASCFAGDPHGCAAGLKSPSPSPIAGMHRDQAYWPRTSRIIRAGVLGSVLKEIGPDRFQQLWRSPEPLDSAFHRIIGRPLGEWSLALVQSRIVPVPEEAGAEGPSVAAALLLGVLLVVAGLATAQRREVR